MGSESDFIDVCRAVTKSQGRGFSPATMSVSPRYSYRKQKNNRAKRTSKSTIPLLLIAYTRLLEILVTALMYVMKLLTGKMIIVTSCLNKMCGAAGSLHKT